MPRRNTALILAALATVLVSQTAMTGDLTPNGQRYERAQPGLSDQTYNSHNAELYADVMLGSLTAQRAFRSALPSIHTYSQTAHMTAFGNGVESDSALASTTVGGKRWVMWDTPWLTHETNKKEDGYYGYKNVSSGFATGISRLIGDSSAVGLAIGYDARKLTNRGDYSWSARTDALHTALYGGTAIGCFFVDGYAGFSRSWHRSGRDVFGISNNPARSHGNYADTTLSAGVKASYVWILPNEFRLTPAIGLDYSYMRLGSFTENERNAGGITTNRIGREKAHFAQTPITVALNKTFSADFLKFKGFCSMWTPEVRGGWVPQFGDKRTSVKLGGITAKSATIGDSYGFVGGGMKIKLADRFIFGVDYNYSFRDKYTNHTVTGTYGVSF